MARWKNVRISGPNIFTSKLCRINSRRLASSLKVYVMVSKVGVDRQTPYSKTICGHNKNDVFLMNIAFANVLQSPCTIRPSDTSQITHRLTSLLLRKETTSLHLFATWHVYKPPTPKWTVRISETVTKKQPEYISKVVSKLSESYSRSRTNERKARFRHTNTYSMTNIEENNLPTKLEFTQPIIT